MKEWVLVRLSSIILLPSVFVIPALFIYNKDANSSFLIESYLIIGIYLVLAYHILHGLLSTYEDYIPNNARGDVYRNQAKILTYLACIFLLKVIVESLF